MPLTKETVMKAFKAANMTPLQMANDLYRATQAAYAKQGYNVKLEPLTRSLSYGDDVYTFKIEGAFAQILCMYGSDDDGQTWTFLFDWSDHLKPIK